MKRMKKKRITTTRKKKFLWGRKSRKEDFGILTPQAHTETIFQSGSNTWNHKTINYDTNHRQKQYEQKILHIVSKKTKERKLKDGIGMAKKIFCVCLLFSVEWFLLHWEEIMLGLRFHKIKPM